MAKTNASGKTSRNYAATESTLINIRALKARVTVLERKVRALQAGRRIGRHRR